MNDKNILEIRLNELENIFSPKQLQAIKEVFKIMEDKYPAYSKEDIISISIETILKNVDIPVDKIKEEMLKDVKKDLNCFTEDLESLEAMEDRLKYVPELEANKVRKVVFKETAKVMADSKEEYDLNVFALTCYVTGMPLARIASLTNLSIEKVQEIISDEKMLAQFRLTVGSMIAEGNTNIFEGLGKMFCNQAVDTYANLEIIQKAVYESYPKKIG